MFIKNFLSRHILKSAIKTNYYRFFCVLVFKWVRQLWIFLLHFSSDDSYPLSIFSLAVVIFFGKATFDVFFLFVWVDGRKPWLSVPERSIPRTSVPNPWHFGTDPDSVPLTNRYGSWSGSGSRFCSFRQWPFCLLLFEVHLHHSS